MDRDSSLGDILGSLMQDPEIMKKVSEAAKSFTAPAPKAPGGEEKNDEGGEGFSIPPELLAKLPSIMSSLSGASPSHSQNSNPGSGADKRRKELLRALKPFLSEKRCSVIDSILQIEGLAGLLSATRSDK